VLITASDIRRASRKKSGWKNNGLKGGAQHRSSPGRRSMAKGTYEKTSGAASEPGTRGGNGKTKVPEGPGLVVRKMKRGTASQPASLRRSAWERSIKRKEKRTNTNETRTSTM